MNAVTQWFWAADYDPFYIGMYDVQYASGRVAMRYWDGKQWFADREESWTWFGEVDGDMWRGLTA